MTEFAPINTQEELDKVLAARLQRERETVARQYETKITELEKASSEKDRKITDFEKQIEENNKQLETSREMAGRVKELEEKNRAYETNSVKMRIAREVGLPFELADRISGEEEKAIREDAEKLKKWIGKSNVPPLGSTEMDTRGEKNQIRQAWAQVAQELKGE